jgi:hypothetical protein
MRSNEHAEKEIRKILPLTLDSKRIKYLGIHLTKEEKNPSNVKKEEIEEESGRWKDFHGYGLLELIL